MNQSVVDFGRQLFFERKLSKNGEISCAHCHKPELHFTDRKRVSTGLGTGKRNTPSLVDSAYQSWFFWDGRADSLWTQALGPLENPKEHGLSRIEAIQVIQDHPALRVQYENLFGTLPPTEVLNTLPRHATPNGNTDAVSAWKGISKEHRFQIDQAFSHIGKAIAAYVGTLTSSPTRFDSYVESLQNGKNPNALASKEVAGLKLFVSPETGCVFCHNGPQLSNGSFQNIGTAAKGSDTGRSEVVEQIQWDRFNCLGEFSDAKKEECTELQYMNKNRHEAFGSFKVPSLRGVSQTAPYMHDGRYFSLEQAIAHYTQVSPDSTHLPSIDLSTEQIEAIAAFLRTLSPLPQ